MAARGHKEVFTGGEGKKWSGNKIDQARVGRVFDIVVHSSHIHAFMYIHEGFQGIHEMDKRHQNVQCNASCAVNDPEMNVIESPRMTE